MAWRPSICAIGFHRAVLPGGLDVVAAAVALGGGMAPVAQLAEIDRLDRDPLGLLGRGPANRGDPGEGGFHCLDPGAAVVGHPDRGAAAAVFAIDAASCDLLAEQPVVAIEQGGWECAASARGLVSGLA